MPGVFPGLNRVAREICFGPGSFIDHGECGSYYLIVYVRKRLYKTCSQFVL